MADQLDSDSAPQRKRIAVACGRCRKRKIRCSGDPGQGQPCSNCKNAGVDQCQFLRVSSREAPLRHDSGEFGYSVGDARVYANRTPVAHGLPYSHDLPTLGSGDVLGPYRGGSAYAYTPATKAYYPAMHAYGTPYPDEFDFGLGVSSPPVMNPEPVGMMPGQWSSTARPKPPSFSSMYLDSEGAFGASYGGAGGLLHRPSHSASSDSANFSFSNVAASLPLSTTPGPDRLLPNPTGRSSTLPYPSSAKPSTPVSASATSTLADVATAASYASGFQASGMTFCSTTNSSLSSHPSSSSRPNSDGYSASESIFSEQERSLQSQGSAFDMAGYTASPRRSSGSGSGSGAGGSVSNHGNYVSASGAHDAAAHHHHASQHHHFSTAYISDPPPSPIAHRHGHALGPGSDSAGHTAVHTDDRHAAVASR
ncbi:hypothetical protein P885DRAFT_46054 [Corynascus similis CBS 632.67]